MTTWEQAKDLYVKRGEGNLEEDIIEYAKNYFLHITPDCIILARCEDTSWFIHLAVGHNCLDYFLSLMPIYRPFVGWCRCLKSNKIKYYQTEKLKRLLC